MARGRRQEQLSGERPPRGELLPCVGITAPEHHDIVQPHQGPERVVCPTVNAGPQCAGRAPLMLVQTLETVLCAPLMMVQTTLRTPLSMVQSAVPCPRPHHVWSRSKTAYVNHGVLFLHLCNERYFFVSILNSKHVLLHT